MKLLHALTLSAACVVLSLVTYARRRDYVFVVLTLIVLLELAASVAVAWR